MKPMVEDVLRFKDAVRFRLKHAQRHRPYWIEFVLSMLLRIAPEDEVHYQRVLNHELSTRASSSSAVTPDDSLSGVSTPTTTQKWSLGGGMETGVTPHVPEPIIYSMEDDGP